MYRNFITTNVTDALPLLCEAVMKEGVEVGSRGGTRTMELTHVGITLENPWHREMLLPDRKVNLAAQIAETMWVLAGRNDVEFLQNYLPRAADFSDDGKTWRAGYGPRLRKWVDPTPQGTFLAGTITDQLTEVVKLLKEDRGTRRAVMSIFDPAVDYQDSKDIPCNNWLSFISRLGKLDLHVAIRSNDLMWGWSGINAFEWSALQEIVAHLVGVEVGGLHFSTTSLHVYDRHWRKASEIGTKAYQHYGFLEDSPRFHIDEESRDIGSLDNLIEQWFSIEYDIRTGSPLVHHYVDEFPEPMMQSWLRVLQWWWGDQGALDSLKGTRLHQAAELALQPPKRDKVPHTTDVQADCGCESCVRYELENKKSAAEQPTDFIQYVVRLHNEKHAAYGDSWKRRGEMLGIMANIARKIDRLGGSETADESSADTAIDLMVYLAKYRVWLDEPEGPIALNWGDSDGTAGPDEMMLDIDRQLKVFSYYSIGALENGLRTSFDQLERLVNEKNASRFRNVDNMLKDAYRLARTLWQQHINRDKQRDNALRNEKTKWDPETEEFFPCSECGTKFPTARDLYAHQVGAHGWGKEDN